MSKVMPTGASCGLRDSEIIQPASPLRGGRRACESIGAFFIPRAGWGGTSRASAEHHDSPHPKNSAPLRFAWDFSASPLGRRVRPISLNEYRKSSRAGEENGFTLIEVLVALTILSVSVAVLFGIFAEGLARTQEAEHEMAARTLAQSLLAQTNAFGNVPFGVQSGRAPHALAWELRVAPYPQNNETTAAVHAAIVSATVSWHESGSDKSLTLTTIQMHPVQQ
jgi:general secretion pathway protein I